jgi:hypothetical protein
MINLQPFCSTDPTREYIAQPYSQDDYTYATNGHICVRVPRREDVPENPKTPQTAKFFRDESAVSWRPLRKVELPESVKRQCYACEGRGTKHDCPDCTCYCEKCDSSGTVVVLASICIGDGLFNIHYVRLLAALPGILVPEQIGPEKSGHPGARMPFKFDGGEGLLFGLNGKCETHIETPA